MLTISCGQSIWATIPLSGLGILSNMMFMWTVTKTKERRSIIDSDIATACFITVINGLHLLLRFILDSNAGLTSPILFNVIDTFGFMLDGIYLWILVILNTFRTSVLTESENQGGFTIQSRRFNKCLLTVLSFVVLTSFGYGMLTRYLDQRLTNVPAVFQVFHAVMLEAPFVALVILNTAILCKLGLDYRRRSHTVNVISQHNIENKRITYIRKFLVIVIVQTCCFIVPSIFTFGVEFVEIHMQSPGGIGDLIINCYWIVKCLLAQLNPVIFGILQTPRKDFVLSDIHRLSVLITPRRVRSSQIQQQSYTTDDVIQKNEEHIPTICEFAFKGKIYKNNTV